MRILIANGNFNKVPSSVEVLLTFSVLVNIPDVLLRTKARHDLFFRSSYLLLRKSHINAQSLQKLSSFLQRKQTDLLIFDQKLQHLPYGAEMYNSIDSYYFKQRTDECMKDPKWHMFQVKYWFQFGIYKNVINVCCVRAMRSELFSVN